LSIIPSRQEEEEEEEEVVVVVVVYTHYIPPRLFLSTLYVSILFWRSILFRGIRPVVLWRRQRSALSFTQL
jgi:hypothetical protein